MPLLAPGPHPDRKYPFDDEIRDLASPLAWTVESFFSAEECAAMIDRFERIGFGEAPINVGGGFERRPEIRNNERVMFDDLALAQQLFERIHGEVPARLFADPLTVCGVNERFRGYRYDPGQQFRDHLDGRFARSENEVSLLTFMIYLNDDFAGGSTRFSDLGVEVVPRCGTALLFQHALRHAGVTVDRGRKYVLRTDVMYSR